MTQRAISKITGITRFRLKSFPQVKAILKQPLLNVQSDRKKRRDARRNEICERVQKAIKDLEAIEAPVTQKAICEIVGMTLTGLKYYPEIKELIEQYMIQHYYIEKRINFKENELLIRVKETIESIEAQTDD